MIPVRAAIVYGMALLLVGVSMGFSVLELTVLLDPRWRAEDD